MSRRDALRQRHRSVSPRAASDTVQNIPVDPDSKRTDVPQPSAENFAQRVRETLMTMLGRQGDPLDRGITLRDLIDSGVVTLNPGYSLGSGAGGLPIGPGSGASSNVKPDLTPPPPVTGFKVSPSLDCVFFETDEPHWAMGHGYFMTNIYAAGPLPNGAPPTFANAKQVYSFSGAFSSWATSPNTTWYFWAKWETRDGVESINPAGGTNGVSTTTGQDVDKLVAAMTGPGEPFKVVTVAYHEGPTDPLDPNANLVPAGTYTADAFIHNAQISQAMIRNLAVTDAKIDTLQASKITAGMLKVGTYVRSSNYTSGGPGSPYGSGFNIDYLGNAEFSNAVFRGNVYADSGYFRGDITGATGSFSGSISAANGVFKGGVAGGSFTGWAWPPSGTGFYLGGPGLLMGNWSTGQAYVAFDTNAGTFDLNSGNNSGNRGLHIDGGGSTFTGNLNMVNGTINMDNGQPTKLRITASTVEVWQGNQLRVRMGVW